MKALLEGSLRIRETFALGRKWRLSLLALGALVFLTGAAVSLHRLEISPEDLALAPLALLLFGLGPLSLIYGAASMMLTARAAGQKMPFGKSFRVSCLAQTAELLPIPGGALVRGAALVKGGATVASSTGVVLANAILWVSSAAFLAGLSLLSAGLLSWLVAIGGLGVAAGACFWIARASSWRIACLSLGLRFLGLGLTATRLFCAFLALSLSISLQESFVFVFAVIAGSASSIAPGGLGVSESIAALLATATGTLPAAAFVAVALNRIIGLFLNALVSCGVFVSLQGADAPNV